MRASYVVMRETALLAHQHPKACDRQWEVIYHGRRGESHRAIQKAVDGIPGVRLVSLTNTRAIKEFRAAMTAYALRGAIGEPLPVVKVAWRWFEQQR